MTKKTSNTAHQTFALHPLATAIAAALPWLAGAQVVLAQQLPQVPTIVHGSATVNTLGGQMTVTNNPNAIINWQSFSIGTQNGVHFQQQDTASQILNRVTGNDPSQILGSLSSNGRVWLINPNGVLFGQGARIDVAGLVASTMDIANADFLAGRYNFVAASGPNRGEVMNKGEIRTTFGGRVWLLGEQVKNEGIVESPNGQILLAAGKSIELIDSGAPNVVVRVTAPENQTINLGTLVAAGGSVDVHASIVNQQGIVRANSVATDASGRVVLRAGDSLFLGEGSKTQAGTVALAAQGNTYLAGSVDASNASGAGGSIKLSTGKLEGMAVGRLEANGKNGGQVRIEGRGTVAFSSTLSAQGQDQGGKVEVTGSRVYVLNADIDVSGGNLGGTVHLGGGWQGSGDLAHAERVIVGTGSEVRANGGIKGGEIAVWSSQSSEHFGSLQAKDGGRIELSSKGDIRYTGNLQAGRGGTVLFDPRNLIITDTPPSDLDFVRTVVADRPPGAEPNSLDDDDELGISVALDDDKMAVGATGDDEGGTNRGAVYLFTGAGSTDFGGLTMARKLDSRFIPEGVLEDRDGFGISVALDGDRMLVGAHADAGRGAVYLFTGVGAAFTDLALKGKLAPGTPIGDAAGMPALRDGDLFGISVALDGDRMAVGAVFDDTGGENRGAVHLLNGVGSDFSGLTYKTKLASGQGMPVLDNNNYHLGISVALDGDRLAVGAEFGRLAAGDTARGAVHLFTGVGTDYTSLTQVGVLAKDTALALSSGLPALVDSDHFGISVALDGDRLAVGAEFDDSAGANRGSVHLFSGASGDFSGLTHTNELTPNEFPDMPASVEGDRFGYSLAIDGEHLIVGARGRDSGGIDRGEVYLFRGLAGATIPTGDASFSLRPSSTSYITPDSIEAVLNGGSGLTLQANNDISVVSPILVDAIGAVGGLILRAGRHVNFGASIVTDNGALTAVAGDPDAIAEYKGPGTPTVTINSGVTLDVGTGTATLAAVGGNFINSSGEEAIVNAPGGGRWLIYAADPATTTEGFSSFSKHYAQSFALGAAEPSYTTTGGNWFLYSVAPKLFVSPSDQTVTYGTPVSFTPTFIGFIDGDTTSIVTGTADWAATPLSSSGHVIAGTHDVSYVDGLVNSLGYQIEDDTTSTGELVVNPKLVTISDVAVLDKVYDGTTVATIGGGTITGAVTGDTLSLSGATAAFDTKDVGVAKIVTVSAPRLGGADEGNYTAELGSPTSAASITRATLFYVADPIETSTLPSTLNGNVAGFVPGEDLASATSGTLTWNTDATPTSLPGRYRIEGSGLSAANYDFAQAPSNATALALVSPSSSPPPGTEDTFLTSLEGVLDNIDASRPSNESQSPIATEVFAAPGNRVSDLSAKPNFGGVNLTTMTREQMVQLIDLRREFKRALFADALYKLRLDESLAEVPECKSADDGNSGLCRMTSAQRQEIAAKVTRADPVGVAGRVRVATLPEIQRKIVIAFGVDEYRNDDIEPLDNAVKDARAVSQAFSEGLGYEVRVYENVTKADIVRELNKLSTEVQRNDSVIVYYAGHGLSREDTGLGYWLPSDASPDDPQNWLSNADISKMLSGINANQVAVISDSCYSGAFTKETPLSVGQDVKPDEVLNKRSVVVMSSGGDEPVVDTGGKGGHSIFASQLMDAIRSVDKWKAGNNIFSAVQEAVTKKFPQKPQYGAAISAGHQQGGDYLFEFRQLEQSK